MVYFTKIYSACRALGVPVVDYTYDDCKLMTRAKEMNLPFATSLVEVQKLRHYLGYVLFFYVMFIGLLHNFLCLQARSQKY